MSQPTHCSWNEIPVEPMSPLLDRQYVSGSELTLARIVLRKGAQVPRHSHPSEQAATVLSGCLKFRLFEESEAPREIIVRAGELLIIPPDLPHEAEALEDTLNLDLFAPPRHDWVNGDDAYLRR